MDRKQYESEARSRWGGTDAYREYERRTAGMNDEEKQAAGEGLLRILAGFGSIKQGPADAPEARELVKTLRDYISAHFYTCTNEILSGLGRLYAAGGEMTENIDRAGGSGTAAFAANAIAAYCER